MATRCSHPLVRIIILALLLVGIKGSGFCGCKPWINEFHYDNTGGDQDEFVEIAFPACSSTTGWQVELYNGNGGNKYATLELSGTTGPFVAVARPEIQNGSPDGIALVDPSGSVEQFISYEGTFTAADGSAAGLESMDIGISQSSATPVGQSLQLTGSGGSYADFTWVNGAASQGSSNAQQTMVVCPSGELIISGVIDGPLPGGRPKAVELYAVTDVPNLALFGLGSANQHAGSEGQELPNLSGSATAGQFLYIASEPGNSGGFASFFGFNPDFTSPSGAASINGDDAIELFKDGVVVDTFGDVNIDGNGQPWEYMDGWAYRKTGTGPDGSVFVLEHWQFSGKDALDDENTNAAAESPFPTASFVPEACYDGATYDAAAQECTCAGTASYDEASGECECAGDDEEWDAGAADCVCDSEFFRDGSGECAGCAGECGEGFNETRACGPSDRQCSHCPAGYYCTDGQPTECDARQGYYCPAFFRPTTAPALYGLPPPARRGGSDPLDGIPCPAGYFCAGDVADKQPCEASPGFYCPAVWQPGDVALETALQGRPCPPASTCAGSTAQPAPLLPACDLVQACGDAANASCAARQSTFYKYDDPPVSYATDASDATCMKTANAIQDANAQWLRVDLGSVQLVRTVRFLSAGAASDFAVAVSVDDAEPQDTLNPSTGAALPGAMEECGVAGDGAGTLEASCAAATKGQFVFVRRSAASAVLEVCDLQIYGHVCEAYEEAVSCPVGLQPSPCTDAQQFCPGCVPCPAGTYSDKEGPYACTPCPGTAAYNERPYSPPGSTSEFQCEGDAMLDSTSTLAVAQVLFDQSADAWLVDVAVEQGPKIQINGLSALYLSVGGDRVDADSFAASKFPCRADGSKAPGADLSASLSETVCCLQDMREGYVMTKIFRDYTNGLDLVAANDVCDAADGSDVLVNADLEVWGAGSVFVDVDGASFATPITIEPLEAPAARRANPEGYEQTQYARITIPDAELYKISRGSDDGSLTDTRELFVGLLDMLPTGTRVVDSAHQQISISLTRTQYGTFAAYGEQNIDYDFISYLNARAHKVFSRDEFEDHYYLEITFVYDDRLAAAHEALPVQDLSSVVLSVGGVATTPCDDTLPDGFEEVVEVQGCGPTELDFSDTNQCPQVSIPDDKFGRIYIPLPLGEMPSADPVSVSFKLNLTDASGRAAELDVAMDIVVADFVSWCDADSGSVDLAERVIPAITIGTESSNPPRLTGFGGDDPEDFSTGAETLQDGLITLELTLNQTGGLADNLEVFFEDVLVIQINPGSDISAAAIKDENGAYIPTYTYDPDSRDATLHIPAALRAGCSNMSYSESFFGCVYKHVLADEEVTDPEWSYLLGSSGQRRGGHASPTTAQDFMATMLGSGTAAVAARELGRDYEEYLLADGFATRTKIGLWINPGHVWGQTVHNSEYSLSESVVIYVLFGVRSGVDGPTRRMLLQATGDGRTALLQTVKYEVTAAKLVEEALGEGVEATEVRAELPLSQEEACRPQAELLAWCARTLEQAVAPHASAIEAVQCVAVEVKNANCANNRRASSSPTAVVDAVIALEASADAKLDMEAVMASGAVLSMQRTGGKAFEGAVEQTATKGGTTGEEREQEQEQEGGSSNTGMVIGAAAGAAAGVVLLAGVAWKLMRRQEQVPTCMRADVESQKAFVEAIMFDKDDVGVTSRR